MRVLIVGSTGCIGSAVAQALRMRGHTVVTGARSAKDGDRSMHVDYMRPRTPEAWAERLRDARIDAVVNAAGILIPTRGQSFERVHAQGPIELFRGAALAGVRCIVQVSALGVGADAADVPYIATKLAADDALRALGAQHGIEHACPEPVEVAVVRPSLVYGPGSASGALFATLAGLPVIGLPGRGEQPVQPIHVYEVAEAIARLLEGPGRAAGLSSPTASVRDGTCATSPPPAGVFELAGPRRMTYREMLAANRRALGLADAMWLPVPMPLMKLGAWCAEALPQKVFARDTLRLLERGNVATANAAPQLLKRAPTGIDEGLRVSPPVPLLDLRVEMSAPVARALRAAVAFLWLYTALVTALRPQGSGVLELLARCGFEGGAGVAVMVASCTLNVALGITMLRQPGAWAYALQIGAVIGYTLGAALAMPELTLDHCGPLAKNVPLLALLVALWCSRTPQTSPQRRGVKADARRATPPPASPPSRQSPSPPASRRTSPTPSAT